MITTRMIDMEKFIKMPTRFYVQFWGIRWYRDIFFIGDDYCTYFYCRLLVVAHAAAVIISDANDYNQYAAYD